MAFRDRSLPAFPEKGRRDLVLIQTLKERGVRPDHIVHLADERATPKAIRSGMAAMLAKTRPGDTVIVYTYSHGWMTGDRGFLATYDTSAINEASAWPMGDQFDLVAQRSRGDRDAEAPDEPGVGRAGLVERAQHLGAWWKGRIVDSNPGHVRVRWIEVGYDSESQDQWVPVAQTRRIQPGVSS